MATICVNTIARNADDFIEPVLKAVIPYTRVVVTIDSRSSDRTREIVSSLPVEWDEFGIENPKVDLIRMRNHQLSKVRENYVWIIDSDEYYPEEVVKAIVKMDLVADAYAFRCWALWNELKAHRASSKNPIPRLFKMGEGLKWKKVFGREVFYNGEAELLPYRYIHFTHLKKDTWRRELNQLRISDDRYLIPVPLEITNEARNILRQTNVTDPFSHSVMGKVFNQG